MNNRSAKKKKRTRGWLMRYLHSPSALRLLIGLVGTAVLLVIFEMAIAPVRYDLKVGVVPAQTIAATKDVVDEISTEQERNRVAAQVTPVYRYQEGITESVMAHFDQIFAQLRAVRQYGAMLPDQSATRIYTAEERQYARDMLTLVTLQDYQISTLLRCSQNELDEAYALLYAALQSTMQGRVIEGKVSQAITSIRQIVDYRMSISLGQNIVPAVLKACVQPNMLIDQEATENARNEARSKVEPVIYKQGQNIVVRGEGRITANQLAMLANLGLLSDGQIDVTVYFGSAVLVLLVIGCMLLLLNRAEYKIMGDTPRFALLFIVLIISLSVCVLARLLDSYLMPTVMCALLATALLGAKPGLICNVALTVLAAALAAGGSEAYSEKMVLIIITGILSGTVAIMVIQQKISKLRMLLVGLGASAVDFLACTALGLMTASDLSGALQMAMLRAGGTIAGTILSIALQPFLEMLFNLPTPMKLMELANPNQPLLRRLLLEAPGTYHHSTIVSNLAEAAAEAVGANPLLARVGGYYHDIGKLKRPLYFKENQMADQNAHDHTNPEVSAAIVTAHTRDGLAMAKAYRLPQAVQDIIYEHHGDTPVMYFYHKALQLAGGKPVDIDSYRYDGKPPRTKEGAIVLLCDTIEAAVRTMKNPTPAGIEEFIVKLVRGKLEDGQLSDSPLTLQDIDKICAAATTVLAGVFHERIEYPDMEEPHRLQPSQRLESAEEEKKEDQDGEIPVIQMPVPEELPTLEMNKNELAPVVVPQAVTLPLAVAPPPTIGPVEIDTLVYMEPLPTKEQEKEMLEAQAKEGEKQPEETPQTETEAAEEPNQPEEKIQ
ncbi:MAG: HDIG domain-containing protein [Clostridia bacterium]|nr:HDIG domain-containing protein [Clostridia bacterium]